MLKVINGIYVTECMTFPRCGHTWLTRILKYYFDDHLNYCEMYNNPELMIDVNENTNFQKNHDINLETKIKNDRKYLIQIRNREDCLDSYFKLEMMNFDSNYDVNTNLNYEKNKFINKFNGQKKISDPSLYLNWIEEKKLFYNFFINKWVFNYIPNSRLVIYENLKHNTFDEVFSILKFMTDNPINEEKLNESINKSNLKHNSKNPFELL